MDFSREEISFRKELKSGIIPGVISSVLFLTLIFIHFLWKFYLFQNIPWVLPLSFTSVVGLGVLTGTAFGSLLGLLYGVLKQFLSKNRLIKALTFSLLITGITAPFVLWKLIWGTFITLYIFLSILTWSLLRIYLWENSENTELEKGNHLFMGLSLVLLISLGSTFAWYEKTGITPEKMLGATSINGVVGNSSLTAGFTKNGRLALLSWPSPSFYDQVDYLTKSRNQKYYGAEPNMGVFSGLYFETGEKKEFRWLWEKKWKHEQRYMNPSSDVLVTHTIDNEIGLEVVTHNFILPENDILIRNYKIKKTKNSPVENLRFYSYSNFHPTSKKIPLLTISHYFKNEPVSAKLPLLKKERAALFVENSILFSECGNEDKETAKEKILKGKQAFSDSNTFTGMSIDSEITNYQVGELNKPESAHLKSKKGNLSNSAFARGKVNGAISTNIENWDNNTANITLYFSAADSAQKTLELLNRSKNISYHNHLQNTENWWSNWLEKAKIPDTQNEEIIKVSKRSLITIRNAYDKETGAIVASVARQPPYYVDWPRDGAFINYALDRAGYPEMVEKHNKFYADVKRAGGSWGMNYYADGSEGGPILFEIDETGLAIWTMWKHYEMTDNFEYLEKVYPSMKKAADFLCSWKDPDSNLHFYANEDDDPTPKQTIDGAVPILVGLKSAIKAGETIGENKNTIQKWSKRASELKEGIEKKLWKPKEGEGDSWMLWPAAELENFDNSKMKSQAEKTLKAVTKNMKAERREEKGIWGAYEVRGILSLSIWTDNEDKVNELKKSLEWLSENVASDDTHHFGEVHRLIKSENQLVWQNRVAIPHVWNHALFYLSALESYETN